MGAHVGVHAGDFISAHNGQTPHRTFRRDEDQQLAVKLAGENQVRSIQQTLLG